MNEQKQRTQTQWGAAEGGASVFFVSAHLSFYIMNIYGYSLYIPYLYIYIYVYIYVLNIFHLFSFVCILKNEGGGPISNPPFRVPRWAPRGSI